MTTLDLSKCSVFVDGVLDVAASIEAATKGLAGFYTTEKALVDGVKLAVHAVFSKQAKGTKMALGTLSTMAQQELIQVGSLDITNAEAFRRSNEVIADFMSKNVAHKLTAENLNPPSAVFYSTRGRGGGTGVLSDAHAELRAEYSPALPLDSLLGVVVADDEPSDISDEELAAELDDADDSGAELV